MHVAEIAKAEAFIQINPITNLFPDQAYLPKRRSVTSTVPSVARAAVRSA